MCEAVDEGTIRGQIRKGCRSVAALEASTGAGSDCGCCRQELRDLLQDEGVAVSVVPSDAAVALKVAAK